MARLIWQDVAAPDFSAVGILQNNAARMIAQAVEGAQAGLNRWREDGRERQGAELARRLMTYSDPAALQAAMAAGQVTGDLGMLSAEQILQADRRYDVLDERFSRDQQQELTAGQITDQAYSREQLQERDASREAVAPLMGQLAILQRDGDAEGVAALLADPANQALIGALQLPDLNDFNEHVARGDTQWRANRDSDWRYQRGTVEAAQSDWRFENEFTDRNDRESADAIVAEARQMGVLTEDELRTLPAFRNASPAVQNAVAASFVNNASGGSGGSSWAEQVGLVASESGGDWGVVNDQGYGGRLQFGDDRLIDAARAGLVPAGTTGAQFARLPPERQRAVEEWHFNDIDAQAERMGINRYIGRTIAGVPITQSSIRGMAHLGGIDGVRRFIETNGRYNPADDNGTRLSDYGRRFAAGPAPERVSPAQREEISAWNTVNAAAGQGRDGSSGWRADYNQAAFDRRPQADIVDELISGSGSGDNAVPGVFANADRERVDDLITYLVNQFDLQPAQAAALVRRGRTSISGLDRAHIFLTGPVGAMHQFFGGSPETRMRGQRYVDLGNGVGVNVAAIADQINALQDTDQNAAGNLVEQRRQGDVVQLEAMRGELDRLEAEIARLTRIRDERGVNNSDLILRAQLRYDTLMAQYRDRAATIPEARPPASRSGSR